MRITVLSGKGGTGKTLVAVNLAKVAGEGLYIDCDVEEPNGALFLRPEINSVAEVTVTNPEPVPELCDGCQECVRFCQYHALAYANQLLFFPELCHDCGGCIRLCPNKALRETKRPVGRVEYGRSGQTETRCGAMEIGEVAGIPIIKELLGDLSPTRCACTIIVDAPPGSGCPVLESVKGSDFCILVAEPTIFGLDNLRLVSELVELFKIPSGVLINKADVDNGLVEDFCREKGLRILGKIPFDRDISLIASQGKLLVEEDENYQKFFAGLLRKIEEVAQDEAVGRLER
jgi:MinD superfamily P-loop ATPase